MYAIIKTGGKQYWVVPGETLQVGKLTAKKGEAVEFEALWAADEEKSSEKADAKGAAGGAGAKVKAEVVRQTRGPRIVVFKKKPKAHYRRKAGHRQDLTEIRIVEISLN
ncbi:MAG: 50S ribosomal protein L21 [Elusimicrobiota bacterium]